jgi:sulfate adenylyltransferase
MPKLVPPHGGGALKPLLLKGKALEEEKKKAKTLKTVPITSREAGDVLMLGIGAFTPLDGFIGYNDWKEV